VNAGEGFFAPAGASRLPAARWREGVCEDGAELVAEEVPVALVYNGISHAVMLASPLDLEDFAIGFSLGERIVRSARDIYGLEVEEGAHGIAIEMRIAGGAMMRLKETRRARTGRTGCGLCGVESLACFEDESFDPPRDGPAVRFDADALHRAMAAMPPAGPAATGNCAACAKTWAATTRSTSWWARWRATVSIRPPASRW